MTLRMNYSSAVFLLALLLTCPAFSAGAPPETGMATRKIVTFHAAVTPAMQDAVMAQVGAKKLKSLDIIGATAVMLNPGQTKKLLGSSAVLSIQDDALITRKNDWVITPPSPNGEFMPWGVVRVGASRVWDVDADGILDESAPAGQNVKVAVIDTGIDWEHPDLIDNFYGGYNAVDPSALPFDDMGHGTHVAGTIAAAYNGLGVVGVAPLAELYAVKAFAGAIAYESDLIVALQWCVFNNMQVINNSWYTGGEPPLLKQALQVAADAGIVLVCCAGNTGPYMNSVCYPAKYPFTIAVSGTTMPPKESIADFSSRGQEIDIAAPGQYVYSCSLNGEYAISSGTSMACPHVTGVVALLISAGLTDEDGDGTLLNEIRLVLYATADQIKAKGSERKIYSQLFGAGMLDAEAAVKAISKPRPKKPNGKR